MKTERIKYNKNSGITLIALVVTIVVLLILAGITINMLFTENGILTKAKEATNKTVKSELEQDIEMSKAEKDIDEITGTDGSLGDYLKKIQNAEIEDLAPDAWYVSRGNSGITVYEDGTIIEGKASIWDGESSEVPEIKEFNWYIYTAEQLKFLADFVNNGNTLTDTQKQMITAKGYKEDDVVINETTIAYLMNDIDLGARHENGTLTYGEKWEPIGISEESYFIGTFEGNNHCIRGMFVQEEKQYAGLFGAVSRIQNITVKDSYVKSTDIVVGAVAGVVDSGTVKNCHNINTTVITDSYIAGGVIGGLWGEKVEDCSNTGKVICNGLMEDAVMNRLGGIVGVAMQAADIENCQNYGEVWGTGGAVAGIIGGTSGIGNVSNCKNEGKVEGGYGFVAGILGLAQQNIIIQHCSNSGNITAPSYAAGIISTGYHTEISNCFNTGDIVASYKCGGIIGEMMPYSSTINCYNIGNITGDNCYIGGVIGITASNNDTTETQDKTFVTYCYNTGKVSGATYGAGGVLGCAAQYGTIIEKCYNIGEVKGNERAGGVVGDLGRASQTINCYNLADVTGTQGIGGIVGYTYYGIAAEGSIINCYNLGNISGETNVGGVLGNNSNSAVIKNSYYLTGTAQLDQGNLGGTDLAKDANYIKTTFLTDANVDETVWEIRANENNGYPVLIWKQD